MSTIVRTSVELLFANNKEFKSHPKQELSNQQTLLKSTIDITLKPALWVFLEHFGDGKIGGGEQNELRIKHNFQLLSGKRQNCPTIERRGQIALNETFL